ncbi:MAG: tetraacyldisaccharide 4'-kinase [Betaproteobacteria bacterium]
MTGFAGRLAGAWYAPRLTVLAVLLWPLSQVFGAVVAIRRALYRSGALRSERVGAPVVVVGNLTAGGSGKTPLALALADALAARGRRPGFVSRGYGGSAASARAVVPGDDPRVVGDEPLLLAASGHPVWIGRRRVDAARRLLAAHPDVDVVIADDGLQHYALARECEIVVVDATRGFGNGLLLPAGPLREPVSRLAHVDAIVQLETVPHGAAVHLPAAVGLRSTMRLEPQAWRNLRNPDLRADPSAWPRGRVHAIAGIGHPVRFFELLRSLGLEAACHPFPDHHAFTPADLDIAGAAAILMTEKDAVKCTAFADDRCWCLPVRARIDAALVDCVLARFDGRQAA